jgi:hypothetical protein
MHIHRRIAPLERLVGIGPDILNPARCLVEDYLLAPVLLLLVFETHLARRLLIVLEAGAEDLATKELAAVAPAPLNLVEKGPPRGVAQDGKELEPVELVHAPEEEQVDLHAGLEVVGAVCGEADGLAVNQGWVLGHLIHCSAKVLGVEGDVHRAELGWAQAHCASRVQLAIDRDVMAAVAVENHLGEGRLPSQVGYLLVIVIVVVV